MAGKNVLVVDDEPSVRELLDGLLRHCGHAPRSVPNGMEALEQLEVEQVDLVITDLHMPGMDGAELAAEIKRRHPRLPILLITGDERIPGGLMVDAVLKKPFSVNQLRAALSILT